MNWLSRGFWSGIMATGPMTLAMFRIHRELPNEDQRPLPPAFLSDRIGEAAHASQHMTHEQRSNFMMASHFGFGVASGSLYSALPIQLKRRPVTAGVLYGLGVWSVSYLGWIPAFGLRPSASKTSAERNIMMILAHVVWGASLGYSDRELQSRSRQLLDGRTDQSPDDEQSRPPYYH